MTILDSLKINCLGRGREADHLKSVICGKPLNAKPAVLMFGDSGIGKTTLLRSLCEIIPSEYPDVLMGFYSVQGGEADPLLMEFGLSP
jgi:ABC-type phosphate/phosphonate transport system ATPase subunit